MRKGLDDNYCARHSTIRISSCEKQLETKEKRRPLVDPPSTDQGGQMGVRRQHGHGHAHHQEHRHARQHGENQPETSHTHAGFRARV